jgi:Zn-dependent protease with chaperone function
LLPVESRNTQWGSDMPKWMIGALVICVAMVIATYIYGIPMFARAVADRFPAGIVARVDTETLAALDRQVFEPSALPRERHDTIANAFRALKKSRGESAPYNLVFRKSDAIGANAMALPGGTIVVTDGLVALARDDREILGVLAHEAGHVAGRHVVRGVVQDSLVGMLLALVIGDVSALAAAASSSVLEASYSRDLEREADAYAIQVLNSNGIPLKFLADMLRRLDSAAGASGMPSALRYLSTHPATDERIRQLEGL